MKNTLLKTICTVMAFLMLATFANISVSAQDIDELNKIDEQTQEEDLLTLRGNARKLEGVWNVQVTGRNCVTGDAIRTFPVMFTFMRGGTMKEWGSGNPPSTRGSGHGIWNYESRSRYTTAFQFFRFNLDGTLSGRQIVRQRIQLSNDGDSYTATAAAQILDINGNVIQNNCATEIGTRFE